MFDVGTSMFFRTVTYHTVGRITAREGNFVQLTDASWVADSGKFSDAIATGMLEEVEYVGDCIVNLDTVVDAFPWVHRLPVSTK